MGRIFLNAASGDEWKRMASLGNERSVLQAAWQGAAEAPIRTNSLPSTAF